MESGLKIQTVLEKHVYKSFEVLAFNGLILRARTPA